VAAEHGIDPAAFVQDSQSRSGLGTLRGLHTRAGRGEAKLVRCARGAIHDVVVDARPGSPTFGRHEPSAWTTSSSCTCTSLLACCTGSGADQA
jgi:dTDP-4-dehydrorhamnose 3,5-epimerase